MRVISRVRAPGRAAGGRPAQVDSSVMFKELSVCYYLDIKLSHWYFHGLGRSCEDAVHVHVIE